jgi:DNA-binding Lrp family transcriptional regulator
MRNASELPEKIIEFFSIHPSATLEAAAGELGVSYSSVQKQVSSLEKNGDISRVFSINKHKIRHMKYIIFIDTVFVGEQPKGPMPYQDDIISNIYDELNMPGRAYSGKLYLMDAEIILGGRNDIILTILTHEPETIGEFVTSFLRTRSGIRATQTAQVYLHKESKDEGSG